MTNHKKDKSGAKATRPNRRRSQDYEDPSRLNRWLEQRREDSAMISALAKTWTISGILEELGIVLVGSMLQLREFLRLVEGQHRALDQLLEALDQAADQSKWQVDDFLQARLEDRLPLLDEIIDWKGLSRAEIAGGLAAASLTLGAHSAKILLAQALPEVIRAAAISATQGEGSVAQADRRLLMDAGGLTPKSGPATIVSVSNTTQVAVGLPQWDDSAKVVEGVFFGKGRERLGLGPAQVESVVEPRIEAGVDQVVEAELVEVESQVEPQLVPGEPSRKEELSYEAENMSEVQRSPGGHGPG